MPTFTSFEEMDAWKRARELTRAVYKASGQGAFSKDFPLRDQIQRVGLHHVQHS